MTVMGSSHTGKNLKELQVPSSPSGYAVCNDGAVVGDPGISFWLSFVRNQKYSYILSDYPIKGDLFAEQPAVCCQKLKHRLALLSGFWHKKWT